MKSSEINLGSNKERVDVSFNLNKEEIKKVLAIEPCLGLRSTLGKNLENEITNGVERGDYLKISRPKCLDDPEYKFNPQSEALITFVDKIKESGLDPMNFKDLVPMIIDNSNFETLYNNYLYSAIDDFVNWTFNNAGMTENSSVEEFLKYVTAFELIVPKEHHNRVEEYMGFEKNYSGKINRDEIKLWIKFGDKQKNELQRNYEIQNLSVHDVSREVTEILGIEVIEMIRKTI